MTPGYHDTPLLPDSAWRVHDDQRPQPPVVTPSTMSAPPSDAVVLFDGSDLLSWEHLDGSAPRWKVEHGYAEVVPQTGNLRTSQRFGDCQLHLEFACPAEVRGEGQGRGNSGVFLMGFYEVQVLDCFENLTYPDGTTGGVYGQFPPLVNACRQPGEWQSYDIVWVAPRFESASIIRPAYITVLLNGLVVQNHCELIGRTGHRIVGAYAPHEPLGPLILQDHGDPVRFRNIWIRPLHQE